jgi:hypothetical protein
VRGETLVPLQRVVDSGHDEAEEMSVEAAS